jgi:anti-sigma factor RsiW
VECPAKSREGTEVLMDHCAGMLEAEVAAAVERHIEQCVACREFCQAQARVWSALDVWDAEPVSESFDARLLERIEERQRGSLWQWIWRPALPVAAVAIVIVAVFLMRVPNGANTPVAGKNVDVVDVDQVEKTLDDLDMLRQLYAAPQAEAVGTKQL